MKTPVALAEEARQLARQFGLDIKILGKEECEELRMGGYLGVQQGSQYPPQFLHLIYRPNNSSSENLVKVALIGKGLTFDRSVLSTPLLITFLKMFQIVEDIT